MSRVCELTGKKPETGNKVSHSNEKSRIRWLPNLQKKRYFVPEISDVVTVTLSTKAIKTIDKLGGMAAAVLKAKEVNLSPVLLKVRNTIVSRSKKKTKKKV